MGFDTVLSISVTLELKAELHAISEALGMSGMGAVIRAVLDGRQPPLSLIPETFNEQQMNVYRQAKKLYQLKDVQLLPQSTIDKLEGV